MNFETFYKDLTSDERWLEVTKMNNKGKDFMKACQDVYADACADSLGLDFKPMAEHRRHVYNKLGKMAAMPAKISLQQEETKPQGKQEPFLTGEARKQKLAEWMASVQSTQANFKIRPISHKEILENGDWKPKPAEIHEPSEFEKAAAYNNYIEKIRRARTALFLEAFPDAEPEEIEKYLAKFKEI